MKQQTWALEPHVCASCGGRVLRCVTGNGITGGGNPIYKCADCGKAAAAMGPEVICWCGFRHRGQNHTAYMCMPFSAIDRFPKLLEAFRSCGCDPGRTEVGIVLEKDYVAAVRATEGDAE